MLEQHIYKVQGTSRACCYSTTCFVCYAVPPPPKRSRMPFKFDITHLQTKQNVCEFLAINEETLDAVLAFDPVEVIYHQADDGEVFALGASLFWRHEIPKKNRSRGVRIVWEPAYLMTTYKALSRKLAMIAQAHLEGFPHPNCFGYVGGRNIRENARQHCGHQNLMSVDIADFFPTIRIERVRRLFEDLEFPEASADLLSRFVTIDEHLPLGFPTSPTIANAVCLAMDIELHELAERNGCAFSRYADDISFSGNSSLPAVAEIGAVVGAHGFELAMSKTRQSKLGQAHYVTGLSVSDPVRPHVPRDKKHRLRQELYYAKKFGLDDHFHHLGINDSHMIQQEINRLDGLVKFTAFHEPDRSTSLKTDWQEILAANWSSPSFQPKNHKRSPFFINVDETELERPDGEHVLAIAMTVSQHEDRVQQGTQEVLQKYLANPWAAGDKEAAKQKGVHFADAHPDLRLRYIEQISSLPFEGYIAFARIPKPNEYEATYLRLLNAMLKRRLMAAEGKFAKFVFEKNDKVSQEAVRVAVNGKFEELRKARNRHPEFCHIEFAGKPHLGLSVPDFLLGVLRNFLMLEPEKPQKPLSRDRLLFERIRDKYRLILDVDDWIEFGRRRPLKPWREDIATSDKAASE